MTLGEFESAKGRRSSNTSRAYAQAVRAWSKVLGYGTPEVAVQEILSGRLDAIDSLSKYVDSLDGRHLAPKSMLLYVSAVKSFLKFHKIRVDSEDLKARVVLPADFEVSTDKAFTDEEIRTLLLRGNLKAKTLLLISLTTGARIGEVSRLKVGHLNLSANTPEITFHAPSNKIKRGRTVFTTGECATVIKQFLGDRIKDTNAWLFPHPSKVGEPETSDAHETQLRRLIKRCGLQFNRLARSVTRTGTSGVLELVTRAVR